MGARAGGLIWGHIDKLGSLDVVLKVTSSVLKWKCLRAQVMVYLRAGGQVPERDRQDGSRARAASVLTAWNRRAILLGR